MDTFLTKASVTVIVPGSVFSELSMVVLIGSGSPVMSSLSVGSSLPEPRIRSVSFVGCLALNDW